MKMANMRRILILLTAVAMAAALGACREEERNRPLAYEKGKYSGMKNAPLSEDRLRMLRQRHRTQASGGI